MGLCNNAQLGCLQPLQKRLYHRPKCSRKYQMAAT